MLAYSLVSIHVKYKIIFLFIMMINQHVNLFTILILYRDTDLSRMQA